MVSLSNSAPNGVIIVKMVNDNMFNEEARRKQLGIFSNTEALVTKRWGTSKSRKPFNDYNHDKLRGKSKSRKEIKCFYCGKLGHIKRECRKFKRNSLKEKVKNKKITKTLQQLHLIVIRSLL